MKNAILIMENLLNLYKNVILYYEKFIKFATFFIGKN